MPIFRHKWRPCRTGVVTPQIVKYDTVYFACHAAHARSAGRATFVSDPPGW